MKSHPFCEVPIQSDEYKCECDIEKEMCTRCEDMVEAESLITYGTWRLCEVCQGDI